MYAYGLCVCIWSGVYAYGGGGVHMEVCVYMHHLAGQKFLDVLVALLFLQWTPVDPLCCCCRDC